MSQTFSSLRFLDGHSYQHSAAFKNPSWNMKYGIQKYVVVTKENLVREVMLDEILTFISRISNTKFDMQVRSYWITSSTSICYIFQNTSSSPICPWVVDHDHSIIWPRDIWPRTFDHRAINPREHLTSEGIYDIWPQLTFDRGTFDHGHLTASDIWARDIWPQLTFDCGTFDRNWYGFYWIILEISTSYILKKQIKDTGQPPLCLEKSMKVMPSWKKVVL